VTTVKRGRLEEIPLHKPLAARLKARPGDGLQLYWLGQAGFIIDIAGHRLVVDPYLSDTLAAKYAGTPRPHIRMMPPPVRPGEIPFVDLVLCTHAHTDHMDPGTLPALLAANPAARLVAPRAMRQQAVDRSGLSGDRLVLAVAAERLDPLAGLSIVPTRAAHETLETDANGNNCFLGFVIDAGSVRLWHSGDGIPFDGLVNEARSLAPDIALLPVNGRRPELSDNGVPGNFTLDEAVALSRAIGVTDMIAHHYGLFDFNTESPDVVDRMVSETTDVRVKRARTDTAFSWRMG
jgi:L-ascorbate metabolism protein UlaG (beta-lactamase superfamily)